MATKTKRVRTYADGRSVQRENLESRFKTKIRMHEESMRFYLEEGMYCAASGEQARMRAWQDALAMVREAPKHDKLKPGRPKAKAKGRA